MHHALIIGAGPFGLALSAYARDHHIEHTVVGKPALLYQLNPWGDR